MMRCLGMSRQQIIRFVRLEALNWCKTAIPAGVALGIAVTWLPEIIGKILFNHVLLITATNDKLVDTVIGRKNKGKKIS